MEIIECVRQLVIGKFHITQPAGKVKCYEPQLAVGVKVAMVGWF